jgi:hypothetical protein
MKRKKTAEFVTGATQICLLSENGREQWPLFLCPASKNENDNNTD